jgi:hypothetical protein
MANLLFGEDIMTQRIGKTAELIGLFPDFCG